MISVSIQSEGSERERGDETSEDVSPTTSIKKMDLFRNNRRLAIKRAGNDLDGKQVKKMQEKDPPTCKSEDLRVIQTGSTASQSGSLLSKDKSKDSPGLEFVEHVSPSSTTSPSKHTRVLDTVMSTSQTPKRSNISPEKIEQKKKDGAVVNRSFRGRNNVDDEVEAPVNELQSEESLSIVSALTFEGTQENIKISNEKDSGDGFVTRNKIRKSISSPKENDRIGDINGKNESPSKSLRLLMIHKKVIHMQEENARLHETNLKLAVELTKLQGKQDAHEHNVTRLNAIHNKVVQIQSENEDLRKVNRDLLKKLEQFEAIALKALPQTPSPQGKIDVLHKKRLSTNLQLLRIDCTGDEDILRDITISPAVKQELEAERNSYLATKKKIDAQKNLCRELLEDAISSKKDGCPICNEVKYNNDENKREENIDDNKENMKKKSRGFILTRKFSRNDRKANEAIQHMAKFEAQNNEALIQQQKTRMRHLQELGSMAELESKHSQRKILVGSLQRQVKEKDFAVFNLESHINVLNEEMVEMRQRHTLEVDEIQYAFDELKTEAGQLVEWLKSQLAEKQMNEEGRTSYAEEIENAKDDDDLESLTPSEKESLLKEIEEERKMVSMHLPHITSSNTAELLGLTAEKSESLDGSTLTPVST